MKRKDNLHLTKTQYRLGLQIYNHLHQELHYNGKVNPNLIDPIAIDDCINKIEMLNGKYQDTTSDQETQDIWKEQDIYATWLAYKMGGLHKDDMLWHIGRLVDSAKWVKKVMAKKEHIAYPERYSRERVDTSSGDKNSWKGIL